jgi:ATP-dependent DNA ligase
VRKKGEPLVPPLRPMVARPAEALPDEEQAVRLAFEPKFDGFLN